MSNRQTAPHLIAGAGILLCIAFFTSTTGGASQDPQSAAQTYGSEQDYGYGARLSEVERAGRDTWYFWTGGS